MSLIRCLTFLESQPRGTLLSRSDQASHWKKSNLKQLFPAWASRLLDGSAFEFDGSVFFCPTLPDVAGSLLNWTRPVGSTVATFGLRQNKKRSVEFDPAFWFSNFHTLVRGYSAAAGLASFESAMALPLTSTAYNRVRSDKYMRPLVKVGVL